MAGMEILGRLVNVIPAADGNTFKMRGCSSLLVVCSTASTGTFTVNETTSFAGSLTPVNVIKNVYWTTQTNGTAAWSKLAYVNGNTPLSAISLGAGGTAGLTTAVVAAFHVFTSELSDPNNYIQITGSGTSHSVIAIPGDLVVQRGPVNLEILGA